jgi:hypothetical protein
VYPAPAENIQSRWQWSGDIAIGLGAVGAADFLSRLLPRGGAMSSALQVFAQQAVARFT